MSNDFFQLGTDAGIAHLQLNRPERMNTMAPPFFPALRDAVQRAARPLHRYRCAACGFEAEHFFWQCPGCLSWDTYPPQRLEDL